GCFWGMQDLIRLYKCVISTRVGYSGGDVPNATYRNHRRGLHVLRSLDISFSARDSISCRRFPHGAKSTAVQFPSDTPDL
ncbi:peptide-methionine (S)-S-oxide reductase, partial [Rhizobium johnstonii]